MKNETSKRDNLKVRTDKLQWLLVAMKNETVGIIDTSFGVVSVAMVARCHEKRDAAVLCKLDVVVVVAMVARCHEKRDGQYKPTLRTVDDVCNGCSLPFKTRPRLP